MRCGGKGLFSVTVRCGASSLLCGAAWLMSVSVIHNKWLLFFSLVGVGIAWASTLAVPYAILAGSLPAEKTGIYLGISTSLSSRRGLWRRSVSAG